MIIIVRSVFHEDNKYYPQIFLGECFCKLQILEYDRINVSKRIDINETNGLCEKIICHYPYFLETSI